MKRKSHVVTVFIAMICICLTSLQASAEANVPVPSDPNNDHGSSDPADGNNQYNNGVKKDKDAPFDAGLSLLIAAGVGAGLKKARDKRKAASFLIAE